MICLSLAAPTLDEAVADVRANLPHIDALELRADLLYPGELAQIGTFPRRLAAADIRLPMILAIRRERDGGRFSGAEAERTALFRSAVGNVANGWFAIDLEEDFNPPGLREAAAEAGTRVIRSLHLPDAFPDDLEERLARMARAPSEILSVAVKINTTRELLRLCRIQELLGSRPRIIRGSGDYGFASGVLAGRLGSMLTCCPAPGRPVPPGQVDAGTLDTLYRYRRLSADTALFCVIGNPVMHSRSPHYHNARFREDGLDAVYLPVQVDLVEDFFALADHLGIRGASVTIPHKAAVIPYLASSDEAVGRIGACNTILRHPGGWHGRNTDVPGFLGPLLAATGRNDLEGSRAAVVGAGGAARGVVFALLSAGASVCVLNRTEARARALAEELRSACRGGATITAGGLDESAMELLESHREVIVQTTSVGMHPNEGGDPLPSYRFRGDETVCDIIYTPEWTRFLGRAEAAGCRTLTGRAMFEEQAAEQYREFRRLV